MLLEVVQILTGLNLTITKAYIFSDRGWFMNVFNVTDVDGNKVTDEESLRYIERVSFVDDHKSVRVTFRVDRTFIELIGTDRPGLLSEVSAALTSLDCNVVNAEVWTHNSTAAAIMQVTEVESGAAITDPDKLSMVKKLLYNVLKGSNRSREAKTRFSHEMIHTDRRLHQMMFDDRDYEQMSNKYADEKEKPKVSVVNWQDRDYSVVNIRCKDKPKLLFDVASFPCSFAFL